MSQTIAPDFPTIKARQKAMWESGDFGRIAQIIMPCAEEFMSRLPLRPGMRVLDVACGNGNLAIIAARRGCTTHGIDIAANLIKQARDRAAAEHLSIDFIEGDAETLPYADASFDAVVSMYGAMFTPRPDTIAAELYRVTKPGGFVAMANWTPAGFIGKMFDVIKAHLPPPPAGLASPMLWGDADTVRTRMKSYTEVALTPRIAAMRYPFNPAGTVDFFRRFYGPTGQAFAALAPERRSDLHRALVDLQSAANTSGSPETTEALAEYLEVIAHR